MKLETCMFFSQLCMSTGLWGPRLPNQHWRLWRQRLWEWSNLHWWNQQLHLFLSPLLHRLVHMRSKQCLSRLFILHKYFKITVWILRYIVFAGWFLICVCVFFCYFFLCRRDVWRNGGYVRPWTKPLPTSVYLPHHLHWTQVSVCTWNTVNDAISWKICYV